MILRLATRQSALALIQSQKIATVLQDFFPEITVEFIKISTQGDQIQDRSLADLGGKGLFIKGLEEALIQKRADLAMHSLKDVPPQLSPEFCIPAVLKRDSPHDVFVSNHYPTLKDLPLGAKVGTCSTRRSAILLRLRPDLKIQVCRGNVDTRLAKLDREEFDALILAEAGLTRLNLTSRIRQVLPVETFIPSVGQGIVAIECLSARKDLIMLLEQINDPNTFLQMTAERAMNRALQASCTSPVGSYAKIEDERLILTGAIWSQDGKQKIETQQTAPLTLPEAIQAGERAAQDLLRQGAEALLNEPSEK